MSKISLKNILSGKTDTFVLISSFIEELQATVCIEDITQKVLLGTDTTIVTRKEPVQLEGEIIGWVKGDDRVSVIASLINLLIQKESEKKKIGSEVLMLYQEVNMIFNFSEKLAQSIGQASIAGITLDEVGRLIKSDSGVIVLWDEPRNTIEVHASFGNTLFDEEKLKANTDLLVNISQS